MSHLCIWIIHCSHFHYVTFVRPANTSSVWPGRKSMSLPLYTHTPMHTHTHMYIRIHTLQPCISAAASHQSPTKYSSGLHVSIQSSAQSHSHNNTCIIMSNCRTAEFYIHGIFSLLHHTRTHTHIHTQTATPTKERGSGHAHRHEGAEEHEATGKKKACKCHCQAEKGTQHTVNSQPWASPPHGLRFIQWKWEQKWFKRLLQEVWHKDATDNTHWHN